MRELIMGVVAVIVFIAVMVAVAFWGRSISCEKKSVSFEDHRFELFAGCMVKHKGMWLPLENIRGFD